MSEHQSEHKERLAAQSDEQTQQQGAVQGLKTQQRQVNERKFNPTFLARLQDPDLESDVHDWLRDEFPALFSGAQIVGQRSSHYERQQELLNRSKAEKYIHENNPGRLLKRHRDVYATMVGASSPGDVTDPISTDEKRVTRNAMEVATARQALAVGARGLRSVTSATSESVTFRNETDEEASGLIGKATGGMFG